jgi:hypothetical protein
MARGWESKSVEEQQSAVTSGTENSPRRRRNPEEVAAQKRREALVLSRSRIQQQLEGASNPQYRKMLETALADLERQIGRPE